MSLKRKTDKKEKDGVSFKRRTDSKEKNVLSLKRRVLAKDRLKRENNSKFREGRIKRSRNRMG